MTPLLYNIFSVCVLGVILHYWYVTLKVYKQFAPGQIGRAMLIAPKSIRIIMFVMGAGGIIGALGAVFRPDYFPPTSSLSQLCLGTAVMLHACLPPSVLVLGASAPIVAYTMTSVKLHLFPLQIAHMLSSSHLGPLAEHGILYDNWRITQDSNWHKAVFSFMEIVPLVILDTRVYSEATFKEVVRIMTSDFRHKTVFITANDGSCPLLDRAQEILGEPLPEVVLVKGREMGSWIREWKRNPHCFRDALPPGIQAR